MFWRDFSRKVYRSIRPIRLKGVEAAAAVNIDPHETVLPRALIWAKRRWFFIMLASEITLTVEVDIPFEIATAATIAIINKTAITSIRVKPLSLIAGTQFCFND